MPAAHVKIPAPRGGTWALCEQLAEGDKVTPALRKEALAQAASFLGGNPALLARFTGSTPAKVSALAARVAAPPAGVAETSKLMAEILVLAEKAAEFLETYGSDEAKPAAKAAKPAVKAAKKPAKPAGGLKASAKPRAAAAAAAAAPAKAKKAAKAVDVEAVVKELVKQAAADFEEDAVAELVKGVTSIASAKKGKKAAPAKAAAPAKKSAAVAKKAAAKPAKAAAKKVRRAGCARCRRSALQAASCAPFHSHCPPCPSLLPPPPPALCWPQVAAAKRK